MKSPPKEKNPDLKSTGFFFVEKFLYLGMASNKVMVGLHEIFRELLRALGDAVEHGEITRNQMDMIIARIDAYTAVKVPFDDTLEN